jgi:CDP-paratose 2-epimerase
MRAFVTGGLGFIGCNLTDRLLRDGHDVVIYDNASRQGVLLNLEWLRKQHGERVCWVKGDTRDTGRLQRAMRQAQVIFHLAAQVAVTTSVSNPREDFEVNALGTLNVLEMARTLSPLPVLLYTSTNKVYGGLEKVEIFEDETRYRTSSEYNQGVSETFPLDFHSPYGCSKGAADQYVRDYYRIFGLPTVVFRMSCIYGERQMGNEDQGWVAHLARTAIQGGRIKIYGDGKQVRDLLYIGDLVDAMLRAVRRIDRTAGRVYNVGGGPENTISVWAEFRTTLAPFNGGIRDADYEDWRPGDQRIYISDIRRIRRELDWMPTVNISEGLRRMVESWETLPVALKAMAR